MRPIGSEHRSRFGSSLVPSALLLALAASSCSVLDRGPDEVELTSDPPGARIELRAPGQARLMPGVTPMTIRLVRTLPEPLEIVFRLEGYEPYVHRLRKVRLTEIEIVEGDAAWKWPTDPIHVSLLARRLRDG